MTSAQALRRHGPDARNMHNEALDIEWHYLYISRYDSLRACEGMGYSGQHRLARRVRRRGVIHDMNKMNNHLLPGRPWRRSISLYVDMGYGSWRAMDIAPMNVVRILHNDGQAA